MKSVISRKRKTKRITVKGVKKTKYMKPLLSRSIHKNCTEFDMCSKCGRKRKTTEIQKILPKMELKIELSP